MTMRTPALTLGQPLLSNASARDDGERSGVNNVDEKSPSLSFPTSHDFPFGSFEVELVLGVRERGFLLSLHFVRTVGTAAALVELLIDHPSSC